MKRTPLQAQEQWDADMRPVRAAYGRAIEVAEAARIAGSEAVIAMPIPDGFVGNAGLANYEAWERVHEDYWAACSQAMQQYDAGVAQAYQRFCEDD